jgi:hypothetical protein
VRAENGRMLWSEMNVEMVRNAGARRFTELPCLLRILDCGGKKFVRVVGAGVGRSAVPLLLLRARGEAVLG